MAEGKAKIEFSSKEFSEIKRLVLRKEHADSKEQKAIRGKIRKIGLSWDKIVGRSIKFNMINLQKLVDNGTIKIIDVKFENQYLEKNTDTQSTFINDEQSVNPKVRKGRINSDEYYVIDLCDEILGMRAIRQYKFDFLKGDTGALLPVDAYYPELDLVVEYYESQHTESTPFFDKKQTVSGVSRGEQRKIYDQRRQEVLPQFGIKLVIISYKDFGTSKRLERNHQHDIATIKMIFKNNGFAIKE